MEQRLVEQLVPQPAIEALGEGILDRLARSDVVPVDPLPVGEAEDGVRGELGAVVADNHFEPVAAGDECLELPCLTHPQDVPATTANVGG